MRYQVPHSSRTLPVLSAILLSLAACSPSMQTGNEDVAGVNLAVDPGTVAPSGSVELTLVNGSSAAVGYNLCSSALEVRVGGGWEPVPSDRVCTMELRTLEPGSEATYPMELPDGLEPGEYRFVTTVEHLPSGGRSGLQSDPFTVSG